MVQVRCPICEQMFEPAASPAMPFCSDRCRRIDLYRWLVQKYAVPVERTADDEATNWVDEDDSRETRS